MDCCALAVQSVLGLVRILILFSRFIPSQPEMNLSDSICEVVSPALICEVRSYVRSGFLLFISVRFLSSPPVLPFNFISCQHFFSYALYSLMFLATPLLFSFQFLCRVPGWNCWCSCFVLGGGIQQIQYGISCVVLDVVFLPEYVLVWLSVVICLLGVWWLGGFSSGCIFGRWFLLFHGCCSFLLSFFLVPSPQSFIFT